MLQMLLTTALAIVEGELGYSIAELGHIITITIETTADALRSSTESRATSWRIRLQGRGLVGLVQRD